MDGISGIRVAGSSGQLFCNCDLVVYSVSRTARRSCLHFPMVFAWSDGLVPLDLYHGEHFAFLHSRPTFNGCRNQRLV